LVRPEQRPIVAAGQLSFSVMNLPPKDSLAERSLTPAKAGVAAGVWLVEVWVWVVEAGLGGGALGAGGGGEAVVKRAGSAFFAGATVFIVVDTWLDRYTEGRQDAGLGVGFALLAGVTLDGVPENLAMGVALVESGGAALLVAIFVSNLPEAVVGAEKWCSHRSRTPSCRKRSRK
jgi:zinc transporter ZupT